MILELVLLIFSYAAYKYWQMWSRQGYWEKHGIKVRPVDSLFFGNNPMTRPEVRAPRMLYIPTYYMYANAMRINCDSFNKFF